MKSEILENKVAIVTGANGQTASYLLELLLEKNYQVIGIIRRTSTNNLERIHHLLANKNLILEEGDITDFAFVSNTIAKYMPDEIYNLAAMSHVGSSFASPISTFQIDAVGPLNFLEAIRNICPHTRFIQSSTSELYGSNYTEDSGGNKYQDENTPFSPNSPYAVAKLAAHELVRLYRNSYNIYSCAYISFNHESKRRGENFVTRKITKWIGDNLAYEDNNGVIRINHNIKNKLKLGYIDAYRDWGHAADVAKAAWMMLQQDDPQDLVISTDTTHSVKDFLNEAFKCIGISDWSPYVEIDPSLYRPCEVPYLCGKSTRAREILNWKPSYSFTELVQEMVYGDIKNG